MERVLERMMAKLDEMGNNFERLEAKVDDATDEMKAARKELGTAHRKLDHMLAKTHEQVRIGTRLGRRALARTAHSSPLAPPSTDTPTRSASRS